MTRYQVTYAAAGRTPDMYGEFRMTVDPKLGPMPTITLDATGEVLILDPRAIIRDEGGHIIYTPRDYPLDTHTKGMREWLLDHPEWGTGLRNLPDDHDIDTVDRASEQDRLYFETHPGLDEYSRPYIPGEGLGLTQEYEKARRLGGTLMVRVTQIEPGMRTRHASRIVFDNDRSKPHGEGAAKAQRGRLVDQVLRTLPTNSVIRTLVKGATVIVVDNVAEYYFGEGERFKSIGEWPNLAPPLRTMFVEYHRPPLLRGETWAKQDADWVPDSVGIYLNTHDWDPETPYSAAAAWPEGHEQRPSLSPSLKQDDGLLGVRWQIIAWMVTSSDGVVRPFDMPLQLLLDAQGQVLVMRAMGVKNGIVIAAVIAQVQRQHGMDIGVDDIGWFYHSFGGPCWFAISLMHCKNVTQTLKIPPEDRKAKAIKHGVPPLARYRVLNIEPMKTVLRTEGQSEKTGLKKALHICRGHFATYDEKPLFGKVRGTFWKPSHVRGSLSEGAVVKDYRVLEPKQQQQNGAPQ